jgi:hypothetical protein
MRVLAGGGDVADVGEPPLAGVFAVDEEALKAS